MSKQYNISLLPGDGTGPEVVNEAVKVLKKTSKDYDLDFVFSNNDLGGDRFLKTGELVTNKDIEQFKNSDAVLLGAIGHPDVKPGILEQGILLKLRKEFDQYINLRLCCRAISSLGTIDLRPTNLSPLRSNRPIISPTSPRCTPSGLTIM